MAKSKSPYLKKVKAAREKEVHDTGIRMANWAHQIALDALILTLGYSEAMHGRTMGPERICEVAAAWSQMYVKIMRGASYEPDADVVRAQVDKLLKPKMPPEIYKPWELRYPEWRPLTLEEEVQAYRAMWKRAGMLTE